MLTLPYGLSFADLHSRDGTLALDREFQRALAAATPRSGIATGRRARTRMRWIASRVGPADRGGSAPRGLPRGPVRHRRRGACAGGAHHELAPLFVVRRQFVQRRAMNAHRATRPRRSTALPCARRSSHRRRFVRGRAGEPAFASAVRRGRRTRQPRGSARPRDRYAAWPRTRRRSRGASRGVLFRAPRKLDMMRLVPIEAVHQGEVTAFTLGAHHPQRRREGFALTDAGTDFAGGLGKRTTASGATSRARIPARAACPRRSRWMAARPQARTSNGVRGAARRLSAGGEDLRVPEAPRRRWPLGALAVMCIDNRWSPRRATASATTA